MTIKSKKDAGKLTLTITGRLTAANAGHEYPAFMKPDGKFELFKDRHVAANAENQLLGNERMEAALNEKTDGLPQEILKAVGNSVNAFVKVAEQFDDLTMLCLEYKG